MVWKLMGRDRWGGARGVRIYDDYCWLVGLGQRWATPCEGTRPTARRPCRVGGGAGCGEDNDERVGTASGGTNVCVCVAIGGWDRMLTVGSGVG